MNEIAIGGRLLAFDVRLVKQSRRLRNLFFLFFFYNSSHEHPWTLLLLLLEQKLSNTLWLSVFLGRATGAHDPGSSFFTRDFCTFLWPSLLVLTVYNYVNRLPHAPQGLQSLQSILNFLLTIIRIHRYYIKMCI